MTESLKTRLKIVPGSDDEKAEGLEMRLQEVDGLSEVLILHLKGYVDTYNSNPFQIKVGKAIDTGFVKLVFNLKEMNYISSTGIGAFTTFLKTVKPLGGDIVLAQMVPKVFEIFQLLGFVTFFNMADTLEGAGDCFVDQKNDVEASVFPKIFICPICSKNLRAPREDRFRCSECKTILAIDKAGKVFLA